MALIGPFCTETDSQHESNDALKCNGPHYILSMKRKAVSG